MRYANTRDLLSGIGAQSRGGRWNPQDSFPTVYASLAPETAQAELLAQKRRLNLPVSAAMPFVMTAFEAELVRLLDLTDTHVQKALCVGDEVLLGHQWWPRQAQATTQVIGRCAYMAGFEGLFVPSAERPAESNLVVFPGNLPDERRLRIINKDQLPPKSEGFEIQAVARNP